MSFDKEWEMSWSIQESREAVEGKGKEIPSSLCVYLVIELI